MSISPKPIFLINNIELTESTDVQQTPVVTSISPSKITKTTETRIIVQGNKVNIDTSESEYETSNVSDTDDDAHPKRKKKVHFAKQPITKSVRFADEETANDESTRKV